MTQCCKAEKPQKKIFCTQARLSAIQPTRSQSSLSNSYVREREPHAQPSASLVSPRGLQDPILSRVRHVGLQGGQRQGLPPHRAHHCAHPGGGEIHGGPGTLQPVATPQRQQGANTKKPISNLYCGQCSHQLPTFAS